MRISISFHTVCFTCWSKSPQKGGTAVYTELRLKLLSGRTMAIAVDPPFDFDDLEFMPGIRAVRLGNLTVLYEGLVYDVRPSGRVL